MNMIWQSSQGFNCSAHHAGLHSDSRAMKLQEGQLLSATKAIYQRQSASHRDHHHLEGMGGPPKTGPYIYTYTIYKNIWYCIWGVLYDDTLTYSKYADIYKFSVVMYDQLWWYMINYGCAKNMYNIDVLLYSWCPKPWGPIIPNLRIGP